MSELLVYEIISYTSCAWGATTLTTKIEHKNGNIQKEVSNLPNQILTRKISSFFAKFAGSHIQWKSLLVATILGYPPKRTCYLSPKKSNCKWGKEN